MIGAALSFLVLLFLSNASAVAGPYEDCILANMKGVQDRAAAFAIRQACETKTTPKKCRDDELQKLTKLEQPTLSPTSSPAANT